MPNKYYVSLLIFDIWISLLILNSRVEDVDCFIVIHMPLLQTLKMINNERRLGGNSNIQGYTSPQHCTIH